MWNSLLKTFKGQHTMKLGKIVSRKTTLFYLNMFLAVFFSSGAPCHAADFFVDDNTCPQTGSGTAVNPYCSIQYALSQAVNGDAVYVHNGTYAEAVTMKTGVDLRNIPAERPVIVATRANSNLVVFDGVSNCTLDGLVLDDSDRKTKDGDAVVLVFGYSDTPGNGLAIRNCEIKGEGTLSRSGIGLKGVLSIEITGNKIYNNKLSGIATKEKNSDDSLLDSTVVIQGNIITKNKSMGILLRGSGTGNRIIIGGDGDDANSITDNGIWSKEGGGIWLQTLQGVSIDNNNIFNSGRAGILLESTSTVEPHITRNTIHDNFASGINIGGESTLTVGTGNEIFLNGVAGITFYVAENPRFKFEKPGASSCPVTITSNNIHTNASAGISIIDNVTGLLTINGNSIYQNEKAGIAFFNSCMAVITENDIHDHTGTAGIFTGTWDGGSPSSKNTPTMLGFDRDNGPTELTINRNKIYDNLSGMRLDHASGTINNNLVYNNNKGGIRFSGNDIAPYEPFGAAWGITALSNNTVADNGSVVDGIQFGAGIVYDDINILNPDGTTREFFDSPLNNRDQGPRFIHNNIVASNAATGIKDGTDCATTVRDYNLYYLNRNMEVVMAQLGGCSPLNNGEFIGDPLFVDRIEYRLQPDSPAKDKGNDGWDMGAYGGNDPITW